VLGRRVLSVPERAVPAGARHEAGLDASALPSGLYFVRMTIASGAETHTQTGRFTVAK
jgi:hypothetical protein